jgi:signal transduction histidine kinase/ActR/RegA family two-component response regulator
VASKDDLHIITEASRKSGDKPARIKPRSIAITRDLEDRERRAQLIVIMGQGVGRKFDVRDTALIGRSPGAEVQVTYTDVSREHARILRLGKSEYEIEDLDSRNGTMINGIPISKEALSFGDKVQIGSHTIMLFTRYNHLEEQLLQSQKMESIGRLAGGVAHDFNNLLGAVMNNVGYLENQEPETTFADQEVQACLVEIKAAVDRAVDLTKQMLGFARRGKYESRPTSVGELVDDIASMVRRTFNRAINVQCDSDSELVVMGDRPQLHQVLMNLCINARDAMPGGGSLTITATEYIIDEVNASMLAFLSPGTYVVLMVTDTGCGMDDDTCSRAFDPFFTTKPPGKGTGLGLATVYGIVQNHGGHIQCASEPGRGTTFRVYLPAVEPKAKSTRDTRPAAVAVRPRGHGLVLLIDDEEVVRKSTGRLLSMRGYKVLGAADGLEGVALFKEHHEEVTFVLLDLIMPVMGGARSFRAIRDVDPMAKVVITSGYTDEDQVHELMADGAVGFLPKPFDRETLERALDLVERGGSATEAESSEDD